MASNNNYMGIVRTIDLREGWDSFGPTGNFRKVTTVDLDNGRTVTPETFGEKLNPGDRVMVQYQGFRYALIEKLAF